jgi:hypothetical protein
MEITLGRSCGVTCFRHSLQYWKNERVERHDELNSNISA